MVTVINLKGGVGKTHTVWSMLGVCQEQHRRALAIDTDMQANLTRSLRVEFDESPDVSAIFHPSIDVVPKEIIRQSKFSSIDFVPASRTLAALDLADQEMWETSDLHLNLHEFLRDIPVDYEFVFIDCPPRLSLVSFAALCASDFVVIPLEAADWGAQGVVDVTEAIQYVQRKYNPKIALLGYLISRFKQRRNYQQSYAKKLREHFADKAFDTVIPDLARFEKSVTHGIPVTLHAPASREANIARQFFSEVEQRIGKHREFCPRRCR